MTRIPIHAIDDAPAGSSAALERQSERVGRTINIFSAMAHSPAVINLYAAEQVLADHSSHDRRVREAIHLTVANVNDCGYCQAAYTGAARAQGSSEEETLQIRRGHVEDDLPPAPALD